MKFLDAFRRSGNPPKELLPRIKRLEENQKKLQSRHKEQEARLKGILPRLEGQDTPASLAKSTEDLQLLCGRVAAAQLGKLPPGTPFAEVEFKVFSQWGEDGIIQHLLSHLSPAETTFVEFGVETYQEASTRFLLMNNNWRGLILDGSEENIRQVRESDLFWKYDLSAKAAFITPANVNELIESQGFGPEVGLLSVDIDGMDYWVLEALRVNATVLICEYNSIFGPVAKVTVPPDEAFTRSGAHSSNLFYGMSLAAAAEAADRKGYDLVGVNSAGNNAFFVRRGCGSPFPARKAAECYVAARFRESRDPSGNLTYLNQEAGRREIAGVPAFDLSRQAVRPLSEILKDSGL